ncbi:class F sortase [Streptomyces hundungensis]|uniref:class F sortase n=1 Tax=Streptomyces hundungensis TaxID=1077946 RepID=UPI001E0A4451|nr:class F sortase [Streptomyces sp. MAG02]
MSRIRAARSAAAALLVLAVAVTAAGCGSATPKPTPPPSVSAASSAPAAARAAVALPASKPVRVRIPSAGVDASPILDLGLAADGTVEVPSVADAERIGWYDKGVTPGQKGPAVLIGHFDTVKGPAVLRNVSQVRVGDTVSVTRADGRTVEFEVRALEQVDKKTFPTQKVYGDTDRPELRIVTCGGELTSGHRPDNIILYADLVA